MGLPFEAKVQRYKFSQLSAIRFVIGGLFGAILAYGVALAVGRLTL